VKKASILRQFANPVAIVVAGALIAAAILFALRWQISGTTNGAYRLDAWSGKIVVCIVDRCVPIGPPNSLPTADEFRRSLEK